MPQESLPQEIYKISNALSENNGKGILVGGAVRDFCINNKIPKDLDVEVYGLEPEVLEATLEKFGRLNRVGKSFGVFKLNTETAEYDFSLPRYENKIAKGHRGFFTISDPSMSFRNAASRRDFTINSIGYDLQKKVLIDPYNGVEDIKKKTLKHIGPSFSEDPLRVLRAMQLSARLQFKIDPNTIKLCKTLNLGELSKERVFEEFRKLLIRAKYPSIGLEYAKEMEILKYYPELKALVGIQQDPEWHPEGDVWTHTLQVVNEAARLRKGEEKNDIILMFSALCHDFGKPVTTKFLRGRWRSPSHDSAGVLPTEQFLRRITNDQNLIQKVKSLVKEHLRPIQLFKERNILNSGTIKRLSMRVNISDLVLLAKADYFGSSFYKADRSNFDAGNWLLLEAEKMAVHKEGPKPLLLGRHLLAMGMAPGPKMGVILKKAFEKQLNGDLDKEEDAISWAKLTMSV